LTDLDLPVSYFDISRPACGRRIAVISPINLFRWSFAIERYVNWIDSKDSLDSSCEMRCGDSLQCQPPHLQRSHVVSTGSEDGNLLSKRRSKENSKRFDPRTRVN